MKTILLFSAIIALIAQNWNLQIDAGQHEKEKNEIREAEESERREHDASSLATLKRAQGLLREYDAENKANGWEVSLKYAQERMKIDAMIAKMEKMQK